MLEFRRALRQIWSAPTPAIVAVISFAAGIGVNAALFGVVNSVLLKPLPIEDPSSLYGVSITEGDRLRTDRGLTLLRLAELERRAPLPGIRFAGIRQSEVILGSDTPQITMAETTVGPYFQTLRVPTPILGRYFGADELGVAVISHSTWVRHFGSDPAILDRVISLTGRPYRIVGVAPPGFRGTTGANIVSYGLWVPSDLSLDSSRSAFLVFTRLPAGWSEKQARVAVVAAGKGLDADDAAVGLDLVDATNVIFPKEFLLVTRFVTLIAFTLGLLILLSASANLIHLLLARANVRLVELAVRQALGGSLAGIAKVLLVEAAIIGTLGVSAGLLTAYLATQAIASVRLPFVGGFDFHLDITPDFRILMFGVGVIALTAWSVIAGVLAVVRKVDAARILSGLAGHQGSMRAGMRRKLVILQVAISTVTLLLAGLLAKSAYGVAAHDVAFDTRDVISGRFDMALQRYDENQGARFFDNVIASARSGMGIDQAALASALPERGRRFRRLGRYGEGLAYSWFSVSPGFFRTVDLPLRSGRDFSLQDSGRSGLVAIVSESFARANWPGQDPIGRTFDLSVVDRSVEVVGVVADGDPTAGPEFRRVVYQPYAQHYVPRMMLLLRGRDSALLRQRITEITRSVDRTVAAFDIMPLSDRSTVVFIGASVAAKALGGFAACGLVLAVTGIYGLTRYLVSTRARELSIRRALGASEGEIRRIVVGESLSMVTKGVMLGLFPGILLAWLIRSALVNTSPIDWSVLIAVGALMMAAGALASLLSVRKAKGEANLSLLRSA